MTSWTEGLIDWSVGVAMGRGTIVITIVCTWQEGVQNWGEIVFLLVHQRWSDVSFKTTTCCLSGKKEARKAIIQSPCIVKVECIEVNQSIDKASSPNTKRVIVGKGEYVVACWGMMYWGHVTQLIVFWGKCVRQGKQQSLSQCTQCNAHCLF